MFKSKQKALSGNSEQVNPLLTTHIVYVNSTPKRGVRQWITTILTDFASRARRHQTSQIGSTRSVMLMQPPHAEFKRTYVTKLGVLNATERS
mgnify:CR=1 FL=1